MAWEEGEFCGQSIIVGDRPMDEFYLCLNKIAAAYIDRYDRKPTVAEILYCFENSIASGALDYFSDPESIATVVIALRGGNDSEL